MTSWNFPALWPGGPGHRQLVDYQTSASWALLAEAARDGRRGWAATPLWENRALAEDHPWRPGSEVPSAYVIPKAQVDAQALRRLIWTLQHGQVEIREASGPVAAGGKDYPAGSYVVLTRQMFGSYANALLERQKYPNLREYPGGPPKAVRCHANPAALARLEVGAVSGPARRRENDPAVAEPAYGCGGLSDNAGKRIAIHGDTRRR